jgi:hypothetical protein
MKMVAYGLQNRAIYQCFKRVLNESFQQVKPYLVCAVFGTTKKSEGAAQWMPPSFCFRGKWAAVTGESPVERGSGMSGQGGAHPEQEVTIGVFQPADAKGVGDLFRRVYGEDYPVKYYYDPDQLNEAVVKHETAPIVARSPEGGIVGTVSGFRSAPNPGLFEIGAGLVLPEYRGLGLNNRLITFIMENEELHVRFGMAVIWGESVCNHVYMQKTTNPPAASLLRRPSTFSLQRLRRPAHISDRR